MKSNLSNTDKRLLLIMFLFVIIVGIGYWGVFPQVKAFYKLGNKIDNEEVKQSINEQKVANLIFVESQCDEYEESMAVNKEKFFDMMSEADIDLLLTGKAIKHKLDSFNLNISLSETPSERKAYRYSELYDEQVRLESERDYYESSSSSVSESDIEDLYNKSDSKKKNNKDDDDDDKVTEPEVVDLFGDTDVIGINNDIYAAKVTMTLGGDRKDLEAFLEEIMDSDKEILITSFSWGKYRVQKQQDTALVSEAGETNGYDIVDMDSLTITMEIYMCEKD